MVSSCAAQQVFDPSALVPTKHCSFDFLFSLEATSWSWPLPCLLGPRQSGSGHLPCLGMAALRPQLALRLCSLPLQSEKSPGSSLAPWGLALRSQGVLKCFLAVSLSSFPLGPLQGKADDQGQGLGVPCLLVKGPGESACSPICHGPGFTPEPFHLHPKPSS